MARDVVRARRVLLWALPVQADAHGLQLSGQDFAVRVRLAGVEDHQQQVRALAHGDDLAPAPCTRQQ